MTADLSVYYERRIVGRIAIHEDGPTFVYDAEWLRTRGAFPISLLMPLTPRRYGPRIFLPWAANLLPEASQLKIVSLKLGAAPEDVIAILAEIGRDTAGALSIGAPGSSSPGHWRRVPTAAALERILDELPSKPFLVGDEGVSMSLAGVQSKLGVAFDENGRICIPIDGAPSTHILKPDSERLRGAVQNEALCLALARLCKLDAPSVTTGRVGKRSYFLIRRYDRVEQDGRWRRLHQEDFCQALGKPPEAKYESNQSGIRGPTLADMFAVTRNAMRAPDLLHLLDQAVFNILCCNTDAHAKNYSLMVTGQGFRLAPIYDVMCGAVWDNVTKNLAQKIAGKNRGDHLKRRHWHAFARDCGLNPTRTVTRVEALARQVQARVGEAVTAVEAMPAGGHAILPVARQAIEARVKAVLAGLEDASEGDADTEPSASATRPSKPTSQKSRRSVSLGERRARTTPRSG